MSVKMMNNVFERSLTTGNARLVLLALADTCSDEGVCFPSIKTIAKKANVSEETTRKFLHAFEKIGLVECEERFNPVGRRTSNTYKLNLEKIGEDELTKDVIYSSIPKSKHRTSDGMNQFIPQSSELVHTYHPLNQFIPSIMNHHKEPSKEPSSDSAIAPSKSSIENNDELFTIKVAESPSAPTKRKPQKSNPIDDAFLSKLKSIYTDKDVDLEYKKAQGWIAARPQRKLTRPFFSNWMSKADSVTEEWKPTTI